MTTPATQIPATTEPREIEAEEIAPQKSSALIGVVEDAAPDAGNSISAFASLGNFRAAQSMALSLASSTLVPAAYRGRANLGNCLVAMEIASRVRASVLMVMQNLHVIEGKPSWSSAFLIATVNACGRFTPLRFEFVGPEKQSGWKCRAFAVELSSDERLDGEWITWDMANAEGWVQRRGSKWQTMPGQMMRYRAAAFWSRVYAPEISLGMHTADEMEDVTEVTTGPSPAARELTAALKQVADAPPPTQPKKPKLFQDCTKKCRVEGNDAMGYSILHGDLCPHFADEERES